ncbi:MAG: AsmA family protein [Gammaproteobacteria bacterium]
MSKLLKILLGIVIAVVVAVGAAAVLLPRFFDPNDYKEQIVAQVEKATGRKLGLEGDLKLSVFPWLGVSTGKLSFGNAPGFGEAPMFSADAVNVRVQLMPLLRKEVLVDTILAEGVNVNLARDASGRTNFEDLAGGKKEDGKGPQMAALVLNGLDLRNASISWDDRQKGEKYTATNLNLKTGTLDFEESIPVSLSTDFDATPKGVSGKIALDGEFEISKDLKRIDITPVDLKSTLAGTAIPGGSSEVKLKTAANVDLNAGTIKVDGLDFAGFGASAQGSVEASDIQSGKPVAKGKVALNAADLPALVNMLASVLPAQAEKLKPLVSAAGKELKLGADFDVDMKAGTARLEGIDFAGLGATLSGDLNAQGIGAGIPTASGKVALAAADLPALLGALSPWLPAKQTAPLLRPFQAEPALARDLKLDAAFDVDAQSGVAKVEALKLHVYGSDITGNVDAKNLKTGKPAATGKVSVASSNGPALITAFTGKQLPAGAKELTLDTAFDVDLAADTARLTGLNFKGLDATVQGDVTANAVSSGKPAASGTLSLASSNAPAMLQALTGKKLPEGAGNDLKASGTFNVDLASGNAKLQDLNVVGLGSEIKGNIDARNIQSKQPAVAGNITVNSKNGPALVSLLTGKPVPSAAGDLKLSTAMNVDLAAGYAKLSGLQLDTMGTSVTGDIDAKNINAKDSSVAGKLNVTSPDVSALLKAYGQAELPVGVSNLNAVANIAGTAQRFRLDPINATARVSGPAVPQGASDVKLSSRADVDLGADTLNMSEFAVSALGLNATGAVNATALRTDPKLSGKLSVAEFNLRQFMKTLGKENALPAMADANTLTKVAVTSAFTGSSNDLSLQGMKLKLDDSNISGDLAVAGFANPAISFNLAVDALNADRYLPPVAEEKQGGGKAEAAAAAPAAPAAAGKLPLDALRRLKVKGDASIGKLTVKKARMSNVRVGINARDGDIQLKPIAAKLYEGSYSGSVGINAKADAAVIRLDHALTGVQIEPLLKDMKGKAKMRGKGDFSLHAAGSGATGTQITRSLNGNGDFVFRNGAIKGFNIAKFLRKAETLFVGDVETEETDFTELTGTYKIVNGVVTNNDLAAKSPLLRIAGQGKADLVSSELDYRIDATVVGTIEGQGGKELADLGGTTIPIKVGGTFDKPSFRPDIESIAKARAKKELQKQLDKHAEELPVPKELLEGVLGTQAPATTEGAATGTAPAQEKTDPTKKLLEGLIGDKKKTAQPPADEATAPAPAKPAAPEAAPSTTKEAAPPPKEPAKKEDSVEDALKGLLKGL